MAKFHRLFSRKEVRIIALIILVIFILFAINNYISVDNLRALYNQGASANS